MPSLSLLILILPIAIGAITGLILAQRRERAEERETGSYSTGSYSNEKITGAEVVVAGGAGGGITASRGTSPGGSLTRLKLAAFQS